MLDAAGIEHCTGFEIGSPYISAARATILRKAMKHGADVFVFIDHDVSWQPEDLLALIRAEGDVVGGTYRFKMDECRYMGFMYTGPNGKPMVREDGAIEAYRLPAGFLKVTRKGIERFMAGYPHLIINSDDEGFDSPDLFNHGAHKGTWYGEDYAFCRNWLEIGEEIWLLPNLSLNHHSEDKVYEGNLHEALLRAPGGAKAEAMA